MSAVRSTGADAPPKKWVVEKLPKPPKPKLLPVAQGVKPVAMEEKAIDKEKIAKALQSPYNLTRTISEEMIVEYSVVIRNGRQNLYRR